MSGGLSRPARRVGQALLVVLVFVAGGAVAGVLWEHWWTPPTGIASGHRFFLDENGLPDAFSGTGMYVLVALVAGFVLGFLVAAVFRRHELTTLAVIVVAAGLGGWVMAQVGHALGPDDPNQLAKSLVDWSPLVGDLTVSGASAYFMMPIGAVAGLAAGMIVEVLIGLFRGSATDSIGTVPT